MSTDSLNPNKFIQKSNISESLIELIKQQILTGNLAQGDRIVETKIAKEYGISQTPVREAIRLLAGEGIVTIIPSKGPVVREFTPQDIYEIYSLRSVMEGLAIRLAIQHATQEDMDGFVAFYEQMKLKLTDDSVPSLLAQSSQIHQMIVDLSRNALLMKTYKSLSFQIAMVNRNLGRESTKQKEVDQHLELIEALISRDPIHAELVMKKHIHRSYTEYIGMKYAYILPNREDAWY